jgi:hypothetical protein
MKNHKGVFLHTFVNENGRRMIERQAQLLKIEDQVASLKEFSWIDGYENGIVEVPMEELLSSNVRFYDNEKDWRDAGSIRFDAALTVRLRQPCGR